jgi:hypothetical protein
LFLVFSLQAVVLLNLVDLPEESSDWRKIKWWETFFIFTFSDFDSDFDWGEEFKYWYVPWVRVIYRWIKTLKYSKDQ